VSRQVFKRCTRCTDRTRLGPGERHCPRCGGSEASWGFVVDIGPDPVTGKRRRRRGGGFATRREAEAALREVLTKRDRGQIVQPTTMTVRAFLVDQWLPAMRLTIGPTTLEGYRGNIERYIVPRVGDLPLRALTPPAINQLYADVRENGRTRGTGPLALKTVREVHVTLHRALEDAVRWDYLETNPSDRASAPSATAARNERRRRIRTWTAAEVNAFAGFIDGHELHELWALAASTGLRRSELLGLRWIDLDLDRRLLSVRRVLVLVGGQPHFKDAPKSAHGFRTISLPPKVTQLLVELRAWQAEQPQLRVIPPEDALVFCRPDGHARHPDHVTSTLRELMIASGLPRIRPMQDLRHTHATLLIGEGGVNVKVVQERLGHHSHSFTADTYQHVIPGMDEAAASRFDQLVFGDGGAEGQAAEMPPDDSQ
jgi:integrase